MSNGDGEVAGKELLRLNLGSGANQFGRSIARIAVAQICQEVGLEGLSDSALDSLSDVAIRYVFDLGRTSRFYANLAGRSDCNVFDVIRGMEDLCFSSASEAPSDCVVSSGVVKEIREYVDSAEEIPFAQPVPHFPVLREKRVIPSFLQMDEVPSFKHIPAWLPAFPDHHTYVHTPVWNERLSDPRKDKVELARQRRKAESSLLSLQQRLVRTGSSMSASSAELYGENGLEANETENSFLAKPLVATERDVSQVDQPVKLSNGAHAEKRAPLLEAFAPAIDALKDGHPSGSEGENIFSQKRTSTLLEFKGAKMVFGESLDLRLRKKCSGKTSANFVREDEKDDKKRRVEFILRHAMENQQEPPHM